MLWGIAQPHCAPVPGLVALAGGGSVRVTVAGDGALWWGHSGSGPRLGAEPWWPGGCSVGAEQELCGAGISPPLEARS